MNRGKGRVRCLGGMVQMEGPGGVPRVSLPKVVFTGLALLVKLPPPV